MTTNIFKIIGYGVGFLGIINVLGEQETTLRTQVLYNSKALEQRSPFGDKKPLPKPKPKPILTTPVAAPIKKPEPALSKRDIKFVGILQMDGFTEYVIHEKIKTDTVYQIINQQIATALNYKAGKYDEANQTLEVFINQEKAICKLGDANDKKGDSRAKVDYGNNGNLSRSVSRSNSYSDWDDFWGDDDDWLDDDWDF